MHQIITSWNLVRPDSGFKGPSTLWRGYSSIAFLTGEFASGIQSGQIKALSVSNIADRFCPTRRDLYIVKGLNKPQGQRDKNTWGRSAGNLVEAYLVGLLNPRAPIKHTYRSLKRAGSQITMDFTNGNSEPIGDMRKLETGTTNDEIGGTEWLLKLLEYDGRVELATRFLHSHIKGPSDLILKDLLTKTDLHPFVTQIGINDPSVPDFIMPKFGIVGDIKTGRQWQENYLLTCAGYALAFENGAGEGSRIDWGMIYFFPTRSEGSRFVRPISLAQTHIFRIDDNLREWFAQVRDEAYAVISKKSEPRFPSKDQRGQCHFCKYLGYCRTRGLVLK